MEKTLGGERLGSGKKMKVQLHNFERSTFNQSRKFISTMAPGLLVPVFKEIGTNGDKFEINIKSAIRTLPTIAPLFGTFKFQCDFFAIPMRLYNGLLHNNAIKIGMQMSKVLFPQIEFTGNRKATNFLEYEKWFSHPSALINYLGYRDLPTKEDSITCIKNASFILAYYDIFKNYYSNKQETKAYMIARDDSGKSKDTISNVCNYYNVIVERNGQEIFNYTVDTTNPTDFTQDIKAGDKITLNLWVNRGVNLRKPFVEGDLEKKLNCTLANIQQGKMRNNYIEYNDVPKWKVSYPPIDRETNIKEEQNNLNDTLFSGLVDIMSLTMMSYGNNVINNQIGNYNIYLDYATEPQILPFDLENIDKMRRDILKVTDLNKVIKITTTTYAPYGKLCESYRMENGDLRSKNSLPLYGLCLKTYQSDQFNNWLANTDNIQMVNEISAINTSSGEFTMDALILAKKVYNMLNRIAMSGGTWQDWQEAVYAEDAVERAETPIYCGGASCEIAFEEVVQVGTSEGNTESLGSLGGKGITMKHEGGNVIINCNEPMLIMGIASITPRIVYSQGNYWFNDLQNIDELHKPSLDGIGFQDLLMSSMVGCTDWEDAQGNINHTAIGKQTAWLNYQTAIDEAFGNFALENNQMYMTLNRNYTKKLGSNGNIVIDDATTYIDPTKYNYPFAQTDLNAQNFWVQLAFDVQARRKMSAKQIPNL